MANGSARSLDCKKTGKVVCMDQLELIEVAAIVTDGVEESELVQPLVVLREAGAKVSILSRKPGPIQTFRHHDKSVTVNVDLPWRRHCPERTTLFNREMLALLSEAFAPKNAAH
jgi:hypothetical protein